MYLAWDTHDAEQTAKLDVANTFTDDQLINSTNQLQLNDTSTYLYDDGSDLIFKDSNNSETTLATLAATGGSDEKVGVDAGATAGYLGAASSDGVLRTGDALSYTDGGDFVTLDLTQLKDASATELTISSGAVTRTSSAHTVDTESDASTDDLDTISGGADGDYITIWAASDARDVVVKNGSDNILTADGSDFTIDTDDKAITLRYDGTNWKEVCRAIGTGTPTVYNKVVYHGAADSSTLTNPTSLTAFDTHNYAIPANDLVDNVAYRVRGVVTFERGTTSIFRLSIMLGSTEQTQLESDNANTNQTYNFDAIVYGTTTAGASAEVRTQMRGMVHGNGGVSTHEGVDYAAVNNATNGSLTLQVGCLFDTSNAGNNATLKTLLIEKVSSSTFT